MKHSRYSHQFARMLACLVCLAVGLVACGASPQLTASGGAPASNASGSMVPPPPIWQLQPDGFVQNTSVGPFRFLYVLDNLGIQRTLLFYAVPGKQRETPQVVSKTLTAKVLSTQELGMVGTFHVGVVDIQWQDQQDQTISLAFSLPTSKATWAMSPLKQTRKAQIFGATQGQGPPESVASNAPIEALNNGSRDGVATFVIAMKKGQPQQPPLFVNVKQDNTVMVISEDEYNRLTAPVPITAGPVNPQPTAELPPATYAPTPTLPPYPGPRAAGAYPSPGK